MPFLLSVLVRPRPHNVGRANWLTSESGTAYNDVTGKCLEEDYNINLSMAAVVA
jgi:hypothetical protein